MSTTGTTAILRTDAEIEASTQSIRHQLRLLQGDDVAEIGLSREKAGLSLPSSYLGSLKDDIQRLVQYLYFTWSTLFKSIMSGELNLVTILSNIFWAWLSSTGLILTVPVCMVGNLPVLSKLWTKKYGTASIINFSNPKLFEALTQQQCDAAKVALSADVDVTATNPRSFSIDAAKLLLQLSAIMYERDSNSMTAAVDTAQTAAKNTEATQPGKGNTPVANEPNQKLSITPGAYMQSCFSASDSAKIQNVVDTTGPASESVIQRFVGRYGINFAVASELKTTSQAYCSVFWDPRSKWVVVAFKGTDPLSVEEWTTDYTATFEDASKDISGFQFLHKGFKDRIIPSDGRQPYYTIRAAVLIVVAELIKGQQPGTKINVWTTGHSLGTVLASVTYAKALTDLDLGSDAVLRDGYVFATPILCDVVSRLSFDAKMLESEKTVPRTLFRITNRDDAVATGLPHLGDTTDKGFGKYNEFNYGHLGVEISMKDSPAPCQMSGDAVKAPNGFGVQVTSKFDQATLNQMRKNAQAAGLDQPAWFGWLQYIPILGRVDAHFTTNYWEQLNRIGLGACVPEKNFGR
ncbi:hypothetical protein FRB94_010562 [Tulasnella sp. JGI-2019a]|nr:hypothetical protein FRB94_010562 [Tulasnella sp. JGI-2019a]